MFALKWNEFRYTRFHFGLWRIAFGFYLAVYSIKLLPFGTELFSNQGPFQDLTLMSFQTFFPMDLLKFGSPSQVQVLLILCSVLATLIMLGLFRRSAALLLYLLTVWFFNRNPYADSPEYGFVNWLIFACIFIPPGEGLSLEKRRDSWEMPRMFYWGAWIVLGVGYFYAGSSKFRSHDPSWMNGTAMYYVLVTDNARLSWYGDLFTNIPKELFIPVTWSALVLQTLSPVFICLRRVRPWWWLASTSVHIGLLFFVNLGQLTLGMIFFHLFLIDARWIQSAKKWIQIRMPALQRLPLKKGSIHYGSESV